MNIDYYGYSYADHIGRTLSEPIDTVFTHIKNSWETHGLISKIRLVWHSVIAAIIFVPCGAAWLVGRAFSYCAASKIDLQGLESMPAVINMNPDLGSRYIDISYLRECLRYTANPEGLKYKINKIINRNYYDDNGKNNLAKAQFDVFIKAIVKKMTEVGPTALTNDQKGAIVERLANAADLCLATWVEVSGKIYFEIYGNADSAESKILRLVQDYKEAIILQILQVDLNRNQWHTLNKARQIFGAEFGLDQTLEKFDTYAHDPNYKAALLSPSDVDYIRNEFYRQYSDVNRLVEAVQTKINMGLPLEIYKSYSGLLKEIAKEHGITTERGYRGNRIDDFITQKCFTPDSQIKLEAVNLMLRHIGLIK